MCQMALQGAFSSLHLIQYESDVATGVNYGVASILELV